MLTVDQSYRGPKIREKKSIFIATVIPISSVQQVNIELDKLRKEFKKATHNAYAYQIIEDNNLVSNCHDDGEVHRTAGEPILKILEHLEMVNVLMVVTRFYGRIHLGPAGLIKQYSGAAKDLLENIDLMEFQR